ncbi:MAG: ribosomal protein S18-alanine N-acetyltransferase [Clostridiaceae bacterium]|nr:ribosomal protein S18-alanine N-acetyltransferase [Clostridiaceae bacterium]
MSDNSFIRFMEYNDLDTVLDLEYKCFEIPWTRNMFEDEFFNSNAVYFVAEEQGKVCGYIGMWKIIDEGHITNLAVHPEFRGKGYGKRLMKSLISYSKKNGITAITLEVRVSNLVAISLYEGFGFTKAGLRKHYYANNNEDALIMWLYLK